MTRRVRLQGVVEYVRGALWVMPTIGVTVAIVAGLTLPTVDIGDSSYLSDIIFGGGPEGARGVLQAVSASVITVTSLVFSLTVVALQLASSQFSPRLLRTFLRLPANQLVLSVFLSTFVYSLVVLRTIRAGDEGERFVPELAVTVSLVLVLASVAALVFFIHHITTEIRVDTLMQRVEAAALGAIDRVHPDPVDGDRPAPAVPTTPPDALAIPSTRSGVVQSFSSQRLFKAACRHGAVLRLAPRVGERVVAGGALGCVWRTGAADHVDLRSLAEEVNAAVSVGFERTMQQDAMYGLRQLVDIAARALSPGVNDPTTAVDAVGHLASLMVVLARRRLVDDVRTDDDGAARFIAERPDFTDYLSLACGQVRRYGGDEPAVAVALLELLRQVGEAAVTADQAEAVAREVDLVVQRARRDIVQPADREVVEQAAADAHRSLRGDEPARALRDDI